MESERGVPTAVGYVIAVKARLSYTVEMEGTGYSASAWLKLAEGYVRIGDNSPATP
jgi:hypothetical protein